MAPSTHAFGDLGHRHTPELHPASFVLLEIARIGERHRLGASQSESLDLEFHCRDRSIEIGTRRALGSGGFFFALGERRQGLIDVRRGLEEFEAAIVQCAALQFECLDLVLQGFGLTWRNDRLELSFETTSMSIHIGGFGLDTRQLGFLDLLFTSQIVPLGSQMGEVCLTPTMVLSFREMLESMASLIEHDVDPLNAQKRRHVHVVDATAPAGTERRRIEWDRPSEPARSGRACHGAPSS